MRALFIVGIALSMGIFVTVSLSAQWTFASLSYRYPVKTIVFSHPYVTTPITMAYMEQSPVEAKGTIIFIHGLGSYSPAWYKQIDAMSKEYRCIAVDLPGYAKSSKGLYPYTMSFYADAIAELITQLQIQSPTITGHSMGGQIALTLSLRYPSLVGKLCLVAPAGIESFSEGEKQWFRENITMYTTKLPLEYQIRQNYYLNFYDFPDDAEFMIQDRLLMRSAPDFENYCYTIMKSVQGMVNEPVAHVLDRIVHPTLVLFGAHDQLIPNQFMHPGKTEDIALIAKEKIKGSRVRIIEQCGHFAQFEQSAKINAALSEFMRER